MIRLQMWDADVWLGGRLVLDGLDMVLNAGEAIAVCGPNGAGKSSAIRAAAGLLALTRGVVRLGDDDIAGLSERTRAERIAYLPQERRIGWNMPAIEVAALGAPFLSAADSLARAQAALEEVGAGALASRGVAEMSGGERARVLLARVLVSEAPTLLADEPIAGLDPDAQLLLLDGLKARTRLGQTVLVSLHDLTLAARWADRILVLHQGREVAFGSPLDALSSDVLQRVFGVRGGWIDGPNGPLLDAVRVQ